MEALRVNTDFPKSGKLNGQRPESSIYITDHATFIAKALVRISGYISLKFSKHHSFK